MNDPGRGGKSLDLPRHPVIKTAPNGNQQIGLGDRCVGRVGTVHAQHSQEEGVIAGKSPQTQEGNRHRYPSQLRQREKLLLCPRMDNTSTGIYDWLLGLQNFSNGHFYLAGMS